MQIVAVAEGRERYRGLLLEADEQWDMVERYLYRGELFVLVADDSDVFDAQAARACMVVTDEGVMADGLRVAEIKNLAVAAAWRRRGLGQAMLEFAARRFGATHDALQVGTGESPLTLPFYEACGFSRSHVVPRFFTEHYDHPIIEAGVQLVDMVYLRRML